MRAIKAISTLSRIGRVTLLIMAAALLMVACSKKTPDEQLVEAEKLLSERQTARGVIKLKELIRDSPDDPAAGTGRLMLAKYYTNEGNAQKALEQLQAVVDAFPAAGEQGQFALAGVISIRVQIGDFEGALASIDKALKAELPEASKGELQMQKANVLLQWASVSPEPKPELTEQGTGILRDLMLNATEGTSRGQAREQLANLYRTRGEFQKSNEVYREYLQKFPGDTLRPHLELAMAINLSQAGEPKKARVLFDPAIKQMREAADAELDQQTQSRMLQDIARYYELMGDYEQAESVKKQIMGMFPMTQMAIDTQFDTARMYLQAGQIEKSVAILEQIKKENPETEIAKRADSWIEAAPQPPAAAVPVPAPEAGS